MIITDCVTQLIDGVLYQYYWGITNTAQFHNIIVKGCECDIVAVFKIKLKN